MKSISLLSGAVACAAIAAAAWGIMSLWPTGANDDARPEETAAAQPVVLLRPGESAVAGVSLQRVAVRRVRQTLALPGRITYDQTKHVALRTGADGVIISVHVTPGDRVAQGQTLAVVRCPSVGAARSELLSREAAHALAAARSDWHASVCDGVHTLVDLIQQGQPIKEIEDRLRGKRLGNYRSAILNAYNERLLAARLVDSAEGTASSGVLAGREVQRRRSDLQSASAALDAAIEQSLFEADRACELARSEEALATREVEVARQRLATLLGVATAGAGELQLDSPDGDLSTLGIKTPLAGTVESIARAEGERVDATSELFIVADTSRLWVEADVRGDDWTAIRDNLGAEVRVTTPATGDKAWTARVRYLGRQVDPLSGSAPLVAELANDNGELRPGMYARIEAPASAEFEALVAPASAVIDVDGVPTVFVPRDGGYSPVPIEVRQQYGDYVDVGDSLAEGQEVVAGGAFVLKSELLLTGEE